MTTTFRFYRRTFLNRPRHHSGAHVIASIVIGDDDDLFGPSTALEITDCYRWIRLEFPLETARERSNSVHKARVLARVCQEFADALALEADRLAKDVSRPTRVVPSK